MGISLLKSKIGDTLFFSKKRVLGTLLGLVLVLSIPLTLTLVSQQQDIRQRAAETLTCTNEPDSCKNPQGNSIILTQNNNGIPIHVVVGNTITVKFTTGFWTFASVTGPLNGGSSQAAVNPAITPGVWNWRMYVGPMENPPDLEGRLAAAQAYKASLANAAPLPPQLTDGNQMIAAQRVWQDANPNGTQAQYIQQQTVLEQERELRAGIDTAIQQLQSQIAFKASNAVEYQNALNQLPPVFYAVSPGTAHITATQTNCTGTCQHFDVEVTVVSDSSQVPMCTEPAGGWCTNTTTSTPIASPTPTPSVCGTIATNPKGADLAAALAARTGLSASFWLGGLTPQLASGVFSPDEIMNALNSDYTSITYSADPNRPHSLWLGRIPGGMPGQAGCTGIPPVSLTITPSVTIPVVSHAAIITPITTPVAVANTSFGLSTYNAVLTCYLTSCPTNIKSMADLNHDGVVDAKDLNILLRSSAQR